MYTDIEILYTYQKYYGRFVAPADSVYAKIVLNGDGVNGAYWFWWDDIEFYDYDEAATNLIASGNPDFEDGYQREPDRHIHICIHLADKLEHHKEYHKQH